MPTLKRFAPSCSLEFTATPDTEDYPSNVLHTVSAAELKSEGMIKLPIVLETQQDWRVAVSQAIARRNELEALARAERAETGEYSHPKVRRWVRNLEGRPGKSFWLQTSSDRFYPDFVCELADGRFLVVEYKGANLWSSDDAKEKRTIGKIWADRSDNRCLFIMPEGPDWNAIHAKIG